ncbi:hypothetical protein TNCV_3637481 [Trichonephila clavipes]|nr:hypothetical protein TNCV_3637481 [Trichonephila clavipes]
MGVFVTPISVVLAELKQCITATVDGLDTDTLRHVWVEIDYRLNVCHVTKGSHIGHLWLSQTKLKSSPIQFCCKISLMKNCCCCPPPLVSSARTGPCHRTLSESLTPARDYQLDPACREPESLQDKNTDTNDALGRGNSSGLILVFSSRENLQKGFSFSNVPLPEQAKFTFLHNFSSNVGNVAFNGKFGSPFLAIYNRPSRQHTENSILIGQWVLFQNAHNSIPGYLHPPLRTYTHGKELISKPQPLPQPMTRRYKIVELW